MLDSRDSTLYISFVIECIGLVKYTFMAYVAAIRASCSRLFRACIGEVNGEHARQDVLIEYVSL